MREDLEYGGREGVSSEVPSYQTPTFSSNPRHICRSLSKLVEVMKSLPTPPPPTSSKSLEVGGCYKNKISPRHSMNFVEVNQCLSTTNKSKKKID